MRLDLQTHQLGLCVNKKRKENYPREEDKIKLSPMNGAI